MLFEIKYVERIAYREEESQKGMEITYTYRLLKAIVDADTEQEAIEILRSQYQCEDVVAIDDIWEVKNLGTLVYIEG